MEQSAIRTLLEDRSKAIRKKDLDQLMSYYSSDVIYFDIPGQYIGSDALRGRFTNWFDSYGGEIVQDISDLDIKLNGDTAITSMLIQSGGTLKNGQEVTLQVRTTSCYQKLHGAWLIIHEHVSLPVDLKTGNAILNPAL